eukprot:6213928-Pleurochrysis_carterae.AAC.2
MESSLPMVYLRTPLRQAGLQTIAQPATENVRNDQVCKQLYGQRVKTSGTAKAVKTAVLELETAVVAMAHYTQEEP